MVPAYEIMHMTAGIRSLIRDSKSHQIDNAISTGGSSGMVTMDQSVLNLYRQNLIDKSTAMGYAVNAEQMKRLIG